MTAVPVLLLPGWLNSGPAHWQSLWEAEHAYVRVLQHDWLRPLRGDWVARLEDEILAHSGADHGRDGTVVLAAHSLGCLLVAAWAAHSRNAHRVRAALLVAPGDPQQAALAEVLSSWSPVALHKLPFASVLIGSRNDPYCRFERAQLFAQAWGSEFIDYGDAGHINADSGFGPWPDGHARLSALRQAQP